MLAALNPSDHMYNDSHNTLKVELRDSTASEVISNHYDTDSTPIEPKASVSIPGLSRSWALSVDCSSLNWYMSFHHIFIFVTTTNYQQLCQEIAKHEPGEKVCDACTESTASAYTFTHSTNTIRTRYGFRVGR